MSTARFSCSIGTTDNTVPLGLEVYFDNALVISSDHVTGEINFEEIFPDSDGDHEIRFVLKNKLPEHTQINDYGNIIRDACVVINNVKLEDIDLGQAFIDQAEYTHDFNGSADTTTQKFFGQMGCNGTVSFRFTTPVYMWLLEHM